MLVKVVIPVVIVVASYLGVIWMTWRELRRTREEYKKGAKDLRQLEMAHADILQTIERIKGDAPKHTDESAAFHEDKLAAMQRTLERNEQKTEKAKAKLVELQEKVATDEQRLHNLKRFGWIRRR